MNSPQTHSVKHYPFPLILSGNKGHDFVDDANYNNELEILCREIWHKPKRQRPALGNIPDYAK